MKFEKTDFCFPEQGPEQGAWESLLNELAATGDRNIAIEFDCGAHSKKVLNGNRIIVIVSLGVVVLLPPSGETLDIKLFGEEGIIERQRARSIVIFIDRICAIEFDAEQVNGPCV